MYFIEVLHRQNRRQAVGNKGVVADFRVATEGDGVQDYVNQVGVNPWQIRKDFSYLGMPGVGYNIKKLIKQISKILKLDVGHKAALVGIGNFGSAVLTHRGF